MPAIFPILLVLGALHASAALAAPDCPRVRTAHDAAQSARTLIVTAHQRHTLPSALPEYRQALFLGQAALNRERAYLESLRPGLGKRYGAVAGSVFFFETSAQAAYQGAALGQPGWEANLQQLVSRLVASATTLESELSAICP